MSGAARVSSTVGAVSARLVTIATGTLARVAALLRRRRRAAVASLRLLLLLLLLLRVASALLLRVASAVCVQRERVSGERKASRACAPTHIRLLRRPCWPGGRTSSLAVDRRSAAEEEEVHG